MGLSPALFMAVFGVICVQLFVLWAQRQQAAQLTPLLALEVVESENSSFFWWFRVPASVCFD